MLFRKKKGVAGLDVGSSSVKVVELEGKLDNLSLVGLGYEKLPEDTIVEGQIMELNAVSEAIDNVCRSYQINAPQVVTGVSGNAVIIKSIVLPAMSPAEIEESIEWHAEEHIPFDLSEVNLDYHVAAETDDSTQVTIAACKRERIDSLRQAIQLSGKQPVAIDVDTFALQNCYELNYQPTEDDLVALINIGATTMNVNIVRGSESVFTRDITLGGMQFTDVLQRNLGLSFQEAEAIKRGTMELEVPVESEDFDFQQLIGGVTDTVALEIQRTFDFYRTTSDDHEFRIERMLISGGGSKLRGLAEELAERLNVEVEVLNPFRSIKVDSRKFDPDYLNEIMPEMAVAVGLAARGVELR